MTGFAREMNGLLSRATIVRLKPHSRVFRHIDEGSYYFCATASIWCCKVPREAC